MIYMTERQMRDKYDGEELGEMVGTAALVPAIRAYLILMGTDLGWNAQYLLREAAHKLEELGE